MVILRVKRTDDRTIRYRSISAFDVDMENKILNYSPYLDGSEWHDVHFKDIKINVSPNMVVVPVIEIELEDEDEEPVDHLIGREEEPW